MNQLSKRIFVVGCSRSGTTLFQSLLMNIENSFSMPETHFFEILPNNYYIAPRSLPPFGKFEYPGVIRERTFDRVVEFMIANSNLHVDRTLLNCLKKKLLSGSLGPGKFFDELTGTYSKANEHILIEKTPSHIFHIPFVRELFPDAVILNIVRDPRDVFLSFKKMIRGMGKAKRSITEFTHLWNKAFEYCINLKIETVRYEDLIESPVERVNGVIGSYGLELTGDVKSRYKEIVNRSETWKSNLKKKIIKDNKKKYLQELTVREISHIERMCERGMKHFGYQKEIESDQKVSVEIGDLLSWKVMATVIRMNIIKFRLKSWIENAE